jgi:hypothetical protein
LNATKHGLAGELVEVEAGLSDEFKERRASWAIEHKPVGDDGNFALDRAVAASLQIERCERTMADLTDTCRTRASLAWDEDRDIDAALIFERLALNPVSASRRLRGCLSGVILLIEAWFALIATLETEQNWSEAEKSKALDLLGVALDCRGGRTRIDDPASGDVVVYRRALAENQVSLLEAIRDEAMVPIDEMERSQALEGDVAILSKEAKLVLRYEREAWKRYHESMERLKPQAEVATTPTRPAEAPRRPIEVNIQPVLTAQEPVLPDPTDQAKVDAWFTEMEARLDALDRRPGSSVPIAAGSRRPAPERSQSVSRRDRKKLARLASR